MNGRVRLMYTTKPPVEVRKKFQGGGRYVAPPKIRHCHSSSYRKKNVFVHIFIILLF